MYYEEDFVEEVRQRSDVVDIISSYVKSETDRQQLCWTLSVS